MRTGRAEGRGTETQEAIAQAALAYQEWRRNIVRVEFAGILEGESPYTTRPWLGNREISLSTMSGFSFYRVIFRVPSTKMIAV